VTSAAELRQALRAVQPGGKVKLQIQRGERTKNVFVRLPDLGPTPVAFTPPAPAAPAPAPAPALVPGRLAIAATAPSLEAQVAPVFSGAPYFLVRDGLRGWVALPNPTPGGAGRGQAAAGLLVAQGVSVVIAGNVGPGAFETLRRAGVQVYTGAFGDIERVERSFRLGALVAATSSVLRGGAPAGGLVAVAALGPGLGFAVGPSLASPYLVLYDLATAQAQVLANPAAGRTEDEVRIAQLLVDRGAAVAIAGSISPAGAQALLQLQVTAVPGATGTVADAITRYVQGR
jgi:predicted Fe-Mo cluster-binding NifX family protein